ncbi:MAG: hypothetical protein ABI613_07610 [Gemmatimonadota bacterium]
MRLSGAVLILVLVACAKDRDDTRSSRSDTTRASSDTIPGAHEATARASAQAAPTYLTGNPIPQLRAAFNGIEAGASISRVRGIMGAPNGTLGPAYQEASRETVVTWIYAGMRVAFTHEKVIDVQCTGRSCITTDGVRNGATVAEIDSVYGLPGGASLADSSKITYPVTGNDSCGLTLTFMSDLVSTMEMSCARN